LYAKNSYSTTNAPPISITTNTTTTNATVITVSQGTNSSSATINFPPAPTPTITITGSGITAVTPTTGTSFTINTPSPSLSINTDTNTGVSTLSLTQGTATSTASIPSPTNYAWGLSGNAGTNPSTNFLGTTDNNGLIFKTNNTERMRLSSGGGVSIGTTTLCSGCLVDVAGKIGVNVNFGYGLISRSGLSGITPSPPSNAGIMGTYGYSLGIGAGIAGVTTNSAAAGSYAVYGNAALPSHFSAYFSGGKNYFEKEVGIGTPSPNYPLHTVYSGTAGAGHYIDYTATSTVSPNSAIQVLSQSSASGNNIFGGYFQVTGSNASTNATAVKAFATSNANQNFGIEASATGTTTNTNYGGYFSASNANTNYGIEASAVGTTTNSNYGGYFFAQDAAYNYGGYFYATKGTNENTAIYANAFSTVNSANNYALRAYATGTANFNYGGYFYAFGGSTNFGVYSVINATNAASSAIYAESNGSNCSAGQFITWSNGNALYAESNGSGDVIYAKAADPSTKNALVIDNGHIKATGTNTLSTTYSIWGGFASPLGTINVQGNDVIGLVYFTTAVSSFTSTPNYCSIQVNFVKPYSSPPHVIITPANGTDMQGLS